MHHFHWKWCLRLRINLLKVHQTEMPEGDLDFHYLLVLMLEWLEEWLVSESGDKVLVSFNDR